MKKSLGIANQFFIVVGILIGQSLSLPFSEPLKWRWVFLIAVVIAVLQLVGSFLLPGDNDEVLEDEGRPLLLQDQEDERVMGIKDLLFSKDSVVRRACEFDLLLLSGLSIG